MKAATIIAKESAEAKEMHLSIEDRTFLVTDLENPKSGWKQYSLNIPTVEFAYVQNELGIHSVVVRFPNRKGGYHYEVA